MLGMSNNCPMNLHFNSFEWWHLMFFSGLDFRRGVVYRKIKVFFFLAVRIHNTPYFGCSQPVTAAVLPWTCIQLAATETANHQLLTLLSWFMTPTIHQLSQAIVCFLDSNSWCCHDSALGDHLLLCSTLLLMMTRKYCPRRMAAVLFITVVCQRSAHGYQLPGLSVMRVMFSEALSCSSVPCMSMCRRAWTTKLSPSDFASPAWSGSTIHITRSVPFLADRWMLPSYQCASPNPDQEQ